MRLDVRTLQTRVAVVNILDRQKFSRQVTLLLAVPILGLGIAGAHLAQKEMALSSELRAFEDVAELTVRLGSLVHEMQKERSFSTLFLGPNGDRHRAGLESQRGLTDDRKAELNEFLAAFPAARYGPEIVAQTGQLRTSMDNLAQTRAKISARSISGPAAAAAISEVNLAVLSVSTQLSAISPTATLARQVRVYAGFLRLKEFTGRERATLNNVLNANALDLPARENAISIFAKQDAYLSEFLELSSADQKRLYEREVSGKEVDEARRIRRLVLEKPDAKEFGVEASHWAGVITAKIDRMKRVEDELAKSLMTASSEGGSAASFSAAFYAGAVLMGVFATIVFSIFLVQALRRKLNSVTRELAASAERLSTTASAMVNTSSALTRVAADQATSLQTTAVAARRLTPCRGKQPSKAAKRRSWSRNQNRGFRKPVRRSRRQCTRWRRSMARAEKSRRSFA